MKSRRTLFLAFYTASPPSSGASRVSFHLARYWPGERMLAQIGEPPGTHEVVPGFRVETLAYSGRGGRWQKLAKVRGWISEMTTIAASYRPETIVLEGASWCAYHWWLVRALRRCVPDARVVYHAHNVEYDLRLQKHTRIVAEITRWFEMRVLSGTDFATAVSPVDAARFRGLYGRQTVLLPNGIDMTWLESATPQSVETIRRCYCLTSETVLFMGAYAYGPNREAIDFLVKEVFPGLVRVKPEVRLLILGGPVPYERAWLVAPGLVPSDDLPSFIGSAAVSVAPIFSGSGTRLKILESLAAGVPVVSTAKGMEGLPLRANVDLLQAETAEEFVGSLLRVFDTNMSVANATKERVTALHWPAIVGSFIGVTRL